MMLDLHNTEKGAYEVFRDDFYKQCHKHLGSLCILKTTILITIYTLSESRNPQAEELERLTAENIKLDNQRLEWEIMKLKKETEKISEEITYIKKKKVHHIQAIECPECLENWKWGLVI